MNFRSIDFANTKKSDRYFLMTSTIVPRPVAVVGTIDPSRTDDERDNLAPFSYFNAVSSDPPCMMISMNLKRDGTKKDTLLNIEATKEFVVHIASADLQIEVDALGAPLPYGQSERAKQGWSLVESTWIKTPRVKELPVAFECVLEKTIEIGQNTVVFGRILGMHLQENLLRPEGTHADPFLLNPLARLDQDYAKIIPLK